MTVLIHRQRQLCETSKTVQMGHNDNNSNNNNNFISSDEREVETDRKITLKICFFETTGQNSTIFIRNMAQCIGMPLCKQYISR